MNRIGTFKELYFLLKTPAFNKDSFLICGYGKLGKTVVAVLQNVFNKKVFITDSNLELIKDLKNGISLDNIQCEKMIPIISIANKDVCNLWEEKLIKKGYSEQDIYCYKSYSYSPGGVIDEINLYYKKGYYSYKDNCYKKIVDVNKEMGKKIKHNKPFFASRWGSVEGSVLVNDKIGNNISLYDLQNNAGVFPIENKNVVKKYIEYSKKAAFQIDYLLLGLWCHNLEELKYWYSPNAKLCRWAIGPGKGNWLKYLANKKVLVIHPFANLMQKQYQQKKDLLFSKKNVLPNFEFIPYKAYNTLGGGGGAIIRRLGTNA